ncbi:zinc finger protein [Macleaya cordata]|uniref:Zinc finger protein n=1 Tax=Macleaya cordata TaxID=56857 RepID=A0A200R064_MACCD|nr:zinc finger protein [Macleaya cordata]
MPIEINNVLSGIFAILVGRNKGLTSFKDQQEVKKALQMCHFWSNAKIEIVSCILRFTYQVVPSTNYSDCKEVLEANPPKWLPDSSTIVFQQRNSPFTALTRGRHHCRFCGGIFLLRMIKREGILINSFSNSAQVAKSDMTDWTLIYRLEVVNLALVSRLNPEKFIPSAMGHGLHHLPYCPLGDQAAKTFCSSLHFAFRAGCCAAAEPVGRIFEGDLEVHQSNVYYQSYHNFCSSKKFGSGQDDMNLGAMSWMRPKVYHCKFCPQTFSTGPGLGGHQKVHKLEKEALRRKEGTEVVIPNAAPGNEWILALQANRSNSIFKTGDSSDAKAVDADLKESKKEPESMECSESIGVPADIKETKKETESIECSESIADDLDLTLKL